MELQLATETRRPPGRVVGWSDGLFPFGVPNQSGAAAEAQMPANSRRLSAFVGPAQSMLDSRWGVGSDERRGESPMAGMAEVNRLIEALPWWGRSRFRTDGLEHPAGR